ncbi:MULTISPECIES: prepilin-type N-terminal cleavage/methylation domain-containing protein [Pectobacterium]|uniref:prepilin-type N-terminal cleavage/methylation domain-containing protein n=1 Tax=Pectobacterium TaxID=122277 RepID=UPI0018DA66DD|nr:MULTISPECIES: prepilin-type N-terminal cleavage/methylation domain-containing protein [Pectobacterium]QPI45318.1 prepilin-type N-terminal cleavage/methylation domain-containing protein [Pectobacterium aroidearum]UUE38664.1 prepilin-type N-terminal cleavage/methylation domain-containing protein [Pectobacterium aroidearum]UUE43044.1 prepilin-type N-terminal cleavage/methylation domain-containing protein [Pectobacterium aroidearum]UUE59727.1 prepilin-type N-terminal cleavage/methylation domain-
MQQNSAVNKGLVSHQSGFSLPETLVAALLFAVSLMGLLQYHQILQQSFQHQWQQRQAWRFAMQQLDAYEAGVSYDPFALGHEASLSKNWQFSVSEQLQSPECRQVTARVMTPRRYQATLNRWFCRTPPV